MVFGLGPSFFEFSNTSLDNLFGGFLPAGASLRVLDTAVVGRHDR